MKTSAFGVVAVGLAAVSVAYAEGPAGAKKDAASQVRRLVDQLTRNPAAPSKADDRLGLYLLNVETRAVTLIADEPDKDLTHCGSASWSTDGRRIVFDATPRDLWTLTRLLALEAGESRPVLKDYGPGNCPSVSPDGTRIAYLLNPGAEEGAAAGVWVMPDDAKNPRRLGGYGRTKWAPDGRQILTVSFGDPCRLTLLDAKTGEERPVVLPKHTVHSVPSWAGADTLVAVVGTDAGTAVALLDVSDPADGSVREVLWTRGDPSDPEPSYPVYAPATGRCVFVGTGPKGKALYSVERGKSGPPKRLEPEGFDRTISDIAVSPDGRYVVFCSNRPATRPGAAPAR